MPHHKDEPLEPQLYRPIRTRLAKAALIWLSLISICLLLVQSPLLKCLSHPTMAPYAVWTALWTALWTGLAPAVSGAEVFDLGGFEWTLSNPELKVSVPGKVPSVVCRTVQLRLRR
jgi:hypothetical protein